MRVDLKARPHKVSTFSSPFHPYSLLPHFPLLHFPPLQLYPCRILHSRIFSRPVPRRSPELFGKGIMTMMLCYNNRPPALSLIAVIYNSLGQNESKELELWPNNEYEIRPYSFQKIFGSNWQWLQNQRRIKAYIMGLAGEGIWGMEMAQLLVMGKAPETRVWGAEPPIAYVSF